MIPSNYLLIVALIVRNG